MEISAIKLSPGRRVILYHHRSRGRRTAGKRGEAACLLLAIVLLAVALVVLPLEVGLAQETCEAPALPAIYEAEDAMLSGVVVNSELRGFTGSGYAARFDEPGDYIRFNICVPKEDYYTLRFQFLNGEQPAVRTLLLDGVKVPGTTRFGSTYDSTVPGFSGEWDTINESVRLSPGSHTVTLDFQEMNDEGDVRIDHLVLADETSSSTTSTRSLLMNNWEDLVAIHHSASLHPDDPSNFGPRLAAIHWAGDWPTNQIDGATAYFRDETSGEVYTEVHQFDSNLYFTDDGIMHVDYLAYGDRALPIAITKEYAMVPEQPFLVVRYTFSNQTGSERVFSFMELVDLNNLTMGNPGGSPGDSGIVDSSSGGGNGSSDDGSGSSSTSGGSSSSSASSSSSSSSTGSSSSSSGSSSDTSSGSGAQTASDLDATDMNAQTTPEPAGQSMVATWYPQYNAWIADMSQTNGAWLLFGAFGSFVDSRAAGTPASGQGLGKGSDILAQFENQAVLENNEEITVEDLLLAMTRTTTIGPGRSMQFSFFYSVQPTLQDTIAVAEAVLKPGSASFWFTRTQNAWRQWLDSGRSTVDSGDPGVDRAYTVNLIALRQSQQPEFGSFVASTNPAYEYKVWPRDSTVSAMSLDAAGYFDQAEKFWMWMAGVQQEGPGSIQEDAADLPDGTWYTNYSFWKRDEPIPFVQPEWDSVGQFLIGVYHHWRLVNEDDPAAARRFLTAIYPSVVDSAEWVAENVKPEEEGEFGFGPPGFSVWEEDFQYTVYTQVTYASGLNAARLLARQTGETDRAREWLEDAITIRDNMVQPVTSEPCGGMWDTERQYFTRGLFPPEKTDSGECEPDERVDGSTDLMWVFGLIPADDPMALAHREVVLDVLTPPFDLPESEGEQPDPQQDFGLGIARYEGDTFYYSSEFSPGGRFESSVPMPVWPWMSAYMSMAEHWLGMDDLAFARLQWYASVTAVGFMPLGEGVDWSTQQPMTSTMSQPDDGGYNVQIALLNYLGLFDPRLPPLEEAETTPQQGSQQ